MRVLLMLRRSVWSGPLAWRTYGAGIWPDRRVLLRAPQARACGFS